MSCTTQNEKVVDAGASRRDEALAESTDVALDQGIGVFAHYHCLGMAVHEGLELVQQFLAFFRLFRGLLLGLQIPLDLLLLMFCGVLCKRRRDSHRLEERCYQRQNS